jgi:hypothetical protein
MTKSQLTNDQKDRSSVAQASRATTLGAVGGVWDLVIGHLLQRIHAPLREMASLDGGGRP